MGTFQVEPTNEMQTREWFAAHLGEFEYSVVVCQEAFPDYILLDGNGKSLRTEAEFVSSNFIAHNHDSDGCDLVVCWIHTTPLAIPVFELSSGKLFQPDDDAPSPNYSVLKVRKARQTKERKLLRKVLESCSEELDLFLRLTAEDALVYRRSFQAVREPRLRLLAAQEKLERAMRKNGGNVLLKRWGRVHPWNLFSLLVDCWPK